MEIILASQSPRRKELLKTIISDFKIIPANIDESKYTVSEIAYYKAKEIAERYSDSLIISADTIVLIDDLILGKPKDRNDAKRMLRMLSKRKHEVWTYYCICCIEKNILINRKIKTEVIFNDLEDDLIEKYIDTLSPMDKAGAYGIQDKEFNLVKKINGSLTNVIGFPIEDIKKDLISIGIITK